MAASLRQWRVLHGHDQVNFGKIKAIYAFLCVPAEIDSKSLPCFDCIRWRRYLLINLQIAGLNLYILSGRMQAAPVFSKGAAADIALADKNNMMKSLIFKPFFLYTVLKKLVC
ncbi:MAG: hypothetical protein U5L00_03730 [Desulfovermiculus sp.]|nr:hypothetical protein [Desulfovermiculus sp.]